MDSAILAVCLFLLATDVLLPSAEAFPMTVDQLLAQFRIFGPKVIEYMKMPNKPAQAKDIALKELWSIVNANGWDRDGAAMFSLGIFDPAYFDIKLIDMRAQIREMCPAGYTQAGLKGILPDRLFKDPAITKNNVTANFKTKLDGIESSVKKKVATSPTSNNADPSMVAFHYELFNGPDLILQHEKTEKVNMLQSCSPLPESDEIVQQCFRERHFLRCLPVTYTIT